MTVRRHGDHKELPEEWSRCSGQLEDASAPTTGPQEPGGRSFLGGSGERPRGTPLACLSPGFNSADITSGGTPAPAPSL